MTVATRKTDILTLLGLAVAIIAFGMATPAYSQDQQGDGLTQGMFGLRAGVGLQPDQFVVGAQVSLNEMLRIFRFLPSIDAGFGDNSTTIAFNGDLFALLTLHGTSLKIYGGGGPTLLFVDRDNSTSWELGLSLVGGLRFPLFRKLFNAEARFGFSDLPETRFMAGMFF